MSTGSRSQTQDTLTHRSLSSGVQAKVFLPSRRNKSQRRPLFSWSLRANTCGSIELISQRDWAYAVRLRWSVEHEAITSKHSLPSRVPLPDNGKLAEKRGRKTTDQRDPLMAGLPKEVSMKKGERRRW